MSAAHASIMATRRSFAHVVPATAMAMATAIAVALLLTACSSVVQGRDTRDLATTTLARPTIAGSPEGASCGFTEDDECRAGLVCDERTWVCAEPAPPPRIACARDDECPSSEPVCVDGACAGRGNDGARCQSNAECEPGFQCSMGGACRSVRTWCTSSAGCPANDTCYDNECAPRW
jgi:hypothetical protein